MLRTLGLAMVVACAAYVPAKAEPVRVVARQDFTTDSYFSLDFGAGGVASALISRTDFELEVDGLTGSARFVSYEQDIDALILPGGLSTGAIRVSIVPDSSTGTYNRATGEFITHELYNIEFEGDLSAYGLVSPVVLPSQSVGAAGITAAGAGSVTMNWAGSNSNNPQIPLDFSYICTVFSTFSVSAPSYIELDLVPALLATDMPSGLKAALMVYLNTAISSANANYVRSAVDALNTFIFVTRRSAPGSVAMADAQSLIGKAREAIRLIQPSPVQVVNSMPQNPSGPISTQEDPKADTSRTIR